MGQGKVKSNFTRTQLGLTILIASILPGLIMGIILNPFKVGGTGMVASGQFSPGFISDCCSNFGSGLLGLIGIIILYTDARHYGGKYRAVYGIALALYISTILSVIAALIGRAPYTETGNLADYRLLMHCGSVGAAAFALIPSVVAWHLFKPGWRLLPIIIGVYRAIIRAGAMQNILRKTTLIPRLLMEEIVYVPSFTENGLVVFFTIANLIGDLLLCGMLLLLLFAPATFMQPRLDTRRLASRETYEETNSN